jgi:elongation factor G
MREGILARFPVVDVKVTLFDGSYHSVDSAGPDFEIAGAMAFRKAMAESRPALLEPIMEVVVHTPEDVMGAILGDLNGRRARIRGMGGFGKDKIIEAEVPHAELLKYTITLTSLTAGRGSFTMTFARYEEVPPDLAQRIIQERKSDQIH